MHIPSSNENLFLSLLSPADRSLLGPHLTQIDLHAHDVLQHPSTRIPHVLFPHAGLVAVTVPTAQRTMREVAVIGREGIVGGFEAASGMPSMTGAQVQISGHASRIPASTFREALERSADMRRLAARCDSVFRMQVQRSALCNATHSVEARICRWLLEIHDRCDCERLPLTQGALAGMLGVRRTTITLVAGRLQTQGAIRCRRGSVYITSREMLGRHSCDCYKHVEEYTDGLFGMPAPEVLHDAGGGSEFAATLAN